MTTWSWPSIPSSYAAAGRRDTGEPRSENQHKVSRHGNSVDFVNPSCLILSSLHGAWRRGRTPPRWTYLSGKRRQPNKCYSRNA